MSDRPLGAPPPLGRGLAALVLLALVAHPVRGASEARPPAAELRFLEPLEGRFKIEMSSALPGRDKQTAHGSCVNRFILASRFLQMECSMGEAEARRDSVVVFGFDERKRQFFALALDSVRNYYLQPWGNYDQAAHSFILNGKERDDSSGSVMTYRVRLRVEGRQAYHLEAFLDVPPGAPLRIVEAVYTRLD